MEEKILNETRRQEKNFHTTQTSHEQVEGAHNNRYQLVHALALTTLA